MNSCEILNIVERIAATTSKTEKLRILSSKVHDDEFKRVLCLSYDPFKTFGVAYISPRRGPDTALWFDENTWALLDDLIARRLTGNAARDAVQEEIDRLDANSAELFRRILKKDLRAGFSESTINKAVKGLIPDFPYMRSCLPKDTDLDKFDWKTGVISQEKADGMFANINFHSTMDVQITSRQGSLFPLEAFAPLIAEVESRLFPCYQYHGELLVRKAGKILPREQSNGVLNSVLKGGQFEPDEVPIYHVWDYIPLECVVTKGKYEAHYKSRLISLLQRLTKTNIENPIISLVHTKIVYSLEDAYKHYAEVLKQGKEGTIIKDPRAIWKDGTSKQQVKLKLEVVVDLEVVKLIPGEGKNESTFGSVLVKTSDDLFEVGVAGFKQEMHDWIWANQSEIEGMIMAVKGNAIMRPSKEGEKHSLFLPRFIEFRSDKTEADSLQRVLDQFESAVKAA